MTLAPPPRLRLFGEPQLLGGEDRAAYDELLARIRAAVKPADIIEEMFIDDVVSLQWEVLRWRRLKSSLMQEGGCEALKRFLVKQCKSDYDLHKEHFKRYLEEFFRNKLPGDQADSAEKLAAECAPNNPAADARLDRILRSIGTDRPTVLADALADYSREVVRDYVRRDPETVALINQILTAAGASIDAFMADVVVEKLDYIERIDRLTSIAESRRNARLRDIEERRAVFGQTLRRSVQKAENTEF